jgi:hypothetical protein
MTSLCFITPTVVVLLEKEGVTKSDVPNDCDWYVWRDNGKRYVKQLRTIASIDDHSDENTIGLLIAAIMMMMRMDMMKLMHNGLSWFHPPSSLDMDGLCLYC